MVKFRWETEFKETEIGEIPKDWEIKRMEELISSILKGKTPIKKYKNEGNFPYLTTSYLRDGEEPAEFYPEHAGYLVEDGEIIVLWDGSNSGEVFLGKRGILASTMAKLLFKDEVNNYYVYQVLKSIEEDIKSAKSGTDDRHVDKEYFMSLQIPFPNYNEQSRIASVLSWFDDLIENKKKQNEILEKTAMAIFKSWFVDFEPFKDKEFVYSKELGREVPKGWYVRKIEEIAKVESGGNAPQKEEYFMDGKIPFVRVKHLSKNTCIEESDFINEKALIDYNLKLFSEGSIIIQKSGESLKEARVNLLPFKSCVVNHLAVFDFNTNKNVHWYLFFVLKNILVDLIEGQSGTALPYLRISDIQNTLILFPPYAVIRAFHNFVIPLFQKIILNQKQIMTLKKVRDTLLPLLVFGKLRVEEI